jgi:hypothetical protein
MAQQKQFDHCKPETNEDAMKNFQKAHQWSQDASRKVQELLKDDSVKPNQVDGIMKTYAFKLFESNHGTICQK